MTDDLVVLNLEAKAKSPIYTGEISVQQKKKRGGGKNIPTRKTSDGYAVVSIYGVLRRYAEKIYKNENPCDIGRNTRGCGKCILCDLFGHLGGKGRVIFEYLKSKEPFNKVVENANRTSLNTSTGQVNSFIEIEQIKEGTVLTGSIIIKDATDKDVEILCSAIKAAEENGIGGWTKRDMGRAVFKIDVKRKKWSEYKKAGQQEANKILGAK